MSGFFDPFLLALKKNRTFIFSEKEGVFRPFLLALNKNRTFIFSETVHKKWRFILYMGAKIKNRTFFSVKNSEIFVSVIKKPDIYFFGENQRFLLALKKKTDIYFFGKEAVFLSIFVSVKKKRTFIFSEMVQKKWRFIFHMEAKSKNWTFFSLKNSEIFVSVKKDGYLFL